MIKHRRYFNRETDNNFVVDYPDINIDEFDIKLCEYHEFQYKWYKDIVKKDYTVKIENNTITVGIKAKDFPKCFYVELTKKDIVDSVMV
jgi:hypothetical protein